MVVKRFEVYLINLDPTVGSELQKTRPCLVISPDEINRHIATVSIASLANKVRDCPQVNCEFEGKYNQVVVDLIHTVDKGCLETKLGKISTDTQIDGLMVFSKMFST